MTVLPKILVVVGPTASGKSDLAIALAKKFCGEIVSADSRQLYKGMEIGAAIGPTRGVRHHLMATLRPDEPITVAEWKRMAEAAIDDILARKKTPIIVGGTGLYTKAIAQNLAIPEVPPNPALRAALEKKSAAQLYAMLRRKDPDYAGRVSPQNRRYATRALEVMAATGKRFSQAQGVGQPKYDVLTIGVAVPRETLYARIDSRVDAMMKRGLLKEAKRLVKKFGWASQSMTAIGYRQFRAYLETGKGLDAAVENLKRDTRRYAKRQMTWYRREPAVLWVTTPAKAIALASKFLSAKRHPHRA